MKKLIAAVFSILVFVGVVMALPSSASAGKNRNWCWKNNDPVRSNVNEDNDKVVVKVNNNAYVSSKTSAVANTGFNKQSWNDDHDTMTSGNATAESKSTINVNQVVIGVSVN